MKKSKREVGPVEISGHQMVESKPSNVVTVKTLRDVRENAMRQRTDLSKTISELTELADEINSTLALLKAQRGD